MPAENLTNSLVNALLRHAPPDQAWVAPTGLGVLFVAGLLIALKGARWAPWIIALAGAGLGAAGGAALRNFLGTPLPPTAALAGVAGLILSWILYRMFLGLFLATTLAAIALALYGGYGLQAPLRAYLERGLDLQTGAVTLPPDVAAVGGMTVAEESQRLWSHMSASVPNLGITVGALLAGAVVVGFIGGILLPRAASVFWAASTGTAILAALAYGLVHLYWPALVPTLSSWGAILVGVLWGTSFLYNLVDVYTPPTVARVRPVAEPGRATAAAR